MLHYGVHLMLDNCAMCSHKHTPTHTHYHHRSPPPPPPITPPLQFRGRELKEGSVLMAELGVENDDILQVFIKEL
jgi:hypothetical protein